MRGEVPASRCRDGAYGEAQSVCGLQEAAAADINIFREYNARRAACSTRSCRRVVEEGGKVWIGPSTTAADVQAGQVALHYFQLQLGAAVAQHAGITPLRMSTT